MLPIDAEGVTGGLVVEVPAEHDRSAAVVGRLSRRAAVWLRHIALDPVVGFVDLCDVAQADRLEVRLREERRHFLRAHRRRAGVRECGVRVDGVDETLVRVERIAPEEDLVELGFAHNEVGPSTSARAGILPDARRTGRDRLRPPFRFPVVTVMRDDRSPAVCGRRAVGGSALCRIGICRRRCSDSDHRGQDRRCGGSDRHYPPGS